MTSCGLCLDPKTVTRRAAAAPYATSPAATDSQRCTAAVPCASTGSQSARPSLRAR
ncbi:hypothetical protein AZA_01562 [Nitrospirillum viridazoti Y2]|nr:hypothetical protein AZA_01562 [Nitrospirillum amazonense Y2]